MSETSWMALLLCSSCTTLIPLYCKCCPTYDEKDFNQTCLILSRFTCNTWILKFPYSQKCVFLSLLHFAVWKEFHTMRWFSLSMEMFQPQHIILFWEAFVQAGFVTQFVCFCFQKLEYMQRGKRSITLHYISFSWRFYPKRLTNTNYRDILPGVTEG